MDRSRFTGSKTGELVQIQAQEGIDWAFIPNPLPPDWSFVANGLDCELMDLIPSPRASVAVQSEDMRRAQEAWATLNSVLSLQR